ncbi:hypothetical protein Acr_27g0001780 [Actinidia rufa]|uniref:Uncharacterized protein n=1 Tax=Actinidia rufa TaxID=165716 RepID=A0A7J0H5V7_9ERIC|nr:hypothetical protein Acr_18g0000920 [Actinidia rufa]GFZ18439.1 hypothetical protein Acr_27g0001780 [Actinidia rufa]
MRGGNVIKPTDFLILLALLPSSPHHTPPAAGNLTPTQYSHHKYQFFSGLLKKRDAGHDDDKLAGSVDVLMMNTVTSTEYTMFVRAQVKAVADAQMESVATVAEYLRAKWVILDQLAMNGGSGQKWDRVVREGREGGSGSREGASLGWQ